MNQFTGDLDQILALAELLNGYISHSRYFTYISDRGRNRTILQVGNNGTIFSYGNTKITQVRTVFKLRKLLKYDY